MVFLISIPIFTGITIIQSGILSRISLLNGSVDLVLLVILAWSLQDRVKAVFGWTITGSLIASMATALPFGTLLLSHLLITSLSLYIKRIIWKVPVLAMVTATFIGTIIVYFASYLAVFLQGIFLPIPDTLNLILLPNLMLNLLAAIPVYILVSDLANWVYPEEY